MPKPTRTLPRREFLSTSLAALGGVGLTGCAADRNRRSSEERPASMPPVLSPGDTLLFQGDSITDAGRSRDLARQPNTQPALGSGYAWLASADLLANARRSRLRIYNRGVSGDKVPDLAARWQQDCLDLKPNVLSILIGVNDIWRTRNGGTYEGTAASYEAAYDALLQRTRNALPDIRLVLCEPFVLRCGSVDETWFPDFDGYRAAARLMADKYGATWVPFQQMFDDALSYAPAEHWVADGVHPSSAGAALMAQAWVRAVGA